MIRIERRYDSPVERVWHAVTEPDEMERWFVVRPSELVSSWCSPW